jgi:hypothetical protein
MSKMSFRRMKTELESLRSRMTTVPSAPGVRVSAELIQAVDDALTAVRRKDWGLLARVLAVKSYLVEGLAEDGEHRFREDGATSVAVLGGTVYSLLDGLQFEAALNADVLPAGMTAFVANGDGTIRKEEAEVGGDELPTLALIRQEDEAIRRRCP